MTNEQVLDMCRRRLNGETLQSIADTYGITRERVRQLTPFVYNPPPCIYPNIAKWMRAKSVPASKLAREAGLRGQSFYEILKGTHAPSKATIDRILAATGLTYEEAFAREETTCADL